MGGTDLALLIPFLPFLASIDHLLNNPYAQPPLPSDWEVGPTYPRHGTVPYYLAPLWDAELAAARKAERAAAKKNVKKGKTITKEESTMGKVPRELKEALKRARGAKGLLQIMEEEVRSFLQMWEEREGRGGTHEEEECNSSDEEIVFVGRNGTMTERPCRTKKPEEPELRLDRLICDGPVDDHGATFG